MVLWASQFVLLDGKNSTFILLPSLLKWILFLTSRIFSHSLMWSTMKILWEIRCCIQCFYWKCSACECCSYRTGAKWCSKQVSWCFCNWEVESCIKAGARDGGFATWSDIGTCSFSSNIGGRWANTRRKAVWLMELRGVIWVVLRSFLWEKTHLALFHEWVKDSWIKSPFDESSYISMKFSSSARH